MGYDEKKQPTKPHTTPAEDIDKDRAPSKPHVEKHLDEGLEETDWSPARHRVISGAEVLELMPSYAEASGQGKRP